MLVGRRGVQTWLDLRITREDIRPMELGGAVAASRKCSANALTAVGHVSTSVLGLLATLRDSTYAIVVKLDDL